MIQYLVLAILLSVRNADSASVLIFTPTQTPQIAQTTLDTAYETIKSKIETTPGWAAVRQTTAAAFDSASPGLAPEALLAHSAIVFLHFDGLQLSALQRLSFEDYIRKGKGFVGIGLSCPPKSSDWPWYQSIVGTTCDSAGAIDRQKNPTQAYVVIDDRVHPSSVFLPERWSTSDFWLDIDESPRTQNHVLATVITSSVKNTQTGWDHPISWCKLFDNGKSWFTILGTSSQIWNSTEFVSHVSTGIHWAAGLVDGDCNSTLDTYWEKQTIDSNVDQPMQMAVAPSGDLFFIERTGALKLYQQSQSATVVVGRLNVSTDVEDGLLGIALDPSFSENGWVYLYYAPKPILESRLSRFTIQNNALDLSSEVVFFSVQTQRKECCHSGGGLKYDYRRGHLYLALGDNTSPFGESDSYSPLDERPGRDFFDAQRTSANTMDLRGKILRIVPYANGSYDVPPDNLFVTGPTRGRREIYIMGVRNPFRYSINPSNGHLYWAEVGPNAEASPTRGPRGVDEINMADSAGNYGWPYCIGPNQGYRNWNFATKTSTRNFDCSRLTNTSPHKDKGGADNLPPARPAMLWYGYTANPEFPEIPEGITSPKTPGRCAMLGTYYQHDIPSTEFSQTTKVLPAYFNNTVFFMEWRREFMMEIKMDQNGQILKLNRLWSTFEWRGPIDMALSPDGWIYVAEYGTDFEGLVRPARITRIRYTTLPRVPTCEVVATPSTGKAPLQVGLSAAGSSDPSGLNLTFSWSLPSAESSDPLTGSSNPNITAVYKTEGLFSAKLTVRNSMGSESSCSAPIAVGNTAPTILFTFPPFGAVFPWGGRIPYTIRVTDAEDGSTEQGQIDCSKIEMQPQVGHDNHYHSLVTQLGCSGVVQTTLNGHEGDVDIFYGLEARFTDNGAGAAGALSARSLIILQPQRKEAETFSTSDLTYKNVRVTTDADGGYNEVFGFRNRSWVCYNRYNLINIDGIKLRAAVYRDSRAEIRVNGRRGQLIGNVDLTTTARKGEGREFATFTGPLSATTPSLDPTSFCINILAKAGGGILVDLNWFELLGPGATLQANVPVSSPNSVSPSVEPQPQPMQRDLPPQSAANKFQAFYLVLALAAWILALFC